MRARLTVETGAASPRVLDLEPGTKFTLGRHRSNHIIFQDDHASRFHAEVFHEHGAWHLLDRETLNGTRLDGEKIKNVTRLADQQIIAIGAARIRVFIDPDQRDTAEIPIASLLELRSPARSVDTSELITAPLQPDEVSVLMRFMNESLLAPTPYDLVQLALQALQTQSRATACGYLSFEADDTELKIVLPAGATVDIRLSRQLTERVRVDGETIWVGGMHQAAELETESLVNYCDAICLPLRAKMSAAADPVLLGALHVYVGDRQFEEREVRFAELVAGFLANTKLLLRSRRALEAENWRLKDHSGGDRKTLIGESKPMRELRKQLAHLATGKNSVLIEGETGVGKELAAAALHAEGPRRAGPFIPVNCAAISADLREAEWFGNEAHAFSGASDKSQPGLFQRADEGTLFLDEIGELSMDSQAVLLRVLEEKKIRPVRGNAEIKVDVRVIAATNRNLEEEVRAGRFRKDLFYRFGSRVRLPSLRDHPEDIPAIAANFLELFGHEWHRRVTLSPEALDRLQKFNWPGNVRQLRSVLENAVGLAAGPVVQANELQLGDESASLSTGGPPSLRWDDLEAWAIREALTRARGVHVQAAKILGIHRETLMSKIRKYEIELT